MAHPHGAKRWGKGEQILGLVNRFLARDMNQVGAGMLRIGETIMTRDKDFKRLIREHAQETGKSYAAALRDFECKGIDPNLRPSVRTTNREYLRFLGLANTEFLRPVSGLGVYNVRFKGDPSAPDEIYLFIPSDTPKERVAELARKAKKAWERPGVLIVIFGGHETGGEAIWSNDLSSRLAPLGIDIAWLWQVSADVVVGI